MISLARRCDPRHIEWVATVLADGALVHPDLAFEMSAFMPILAGSVSYMRSFSPHIIHYSSAQTALHDVLQKSDVLVVWGLPNLRSLVKDFSKPVVMVSHGSGEWTRWTVQSSETGVTDFVAVSEAARAPFRREIQKKVTIIPNGIDVERCTPTLPRQQIRAKWGYNDQHRLIGYVGRFSAEKNPTAAACGANYLGKDFHAIYAGDGWQERELRQQVRTIAGPRAKFVPMDRQVGNLLSALDVFILASPSEGFSLAMAEAWYCGVPVVATRVGAVPELEKRHGSLISPVEINPSARDIARAVEHALLPAFRSEVVPRAQEAVSKYYTAGTMARRWTDFLIGICGETTE